MFDILGKLSSIVKNLNVFNNNSINSNNRSISFDVHIDVPENSKISKEELVQAAKEFKTILDEQKNFLLQTPQFSENLALTEGYISTDKDIDLRIFIKNSITQKDKEIWLSSLIIRDHFINGDVETVNKLKAQIVSFYLDRGKNIANLCTAGYLESLIIPLYKYLVCEKSNESLFLEIYEAIVTETPCAVFVSQYRTHEDIKKEVLSKLDLVKKYGWKKVSVHGIGEANVKEIKKLIAEIEASHENILTVDVNSHESQGKIITVHLNLI
jgi:hypothetical protein